MSEWNKSFQAEKAASSLTESYQQKKTDPTKSSKPVHESKRMAKYQEEVFKWYSGRRGSFQWIRKKKEEWYKQEEKYVLQTVINQKKVNRKEMIMLMQPIIQEEQEKEEKYRKAEKRIKEADRIFQAAVHLLFPKPPIWFEDDVSPPKRYPSIDEMDVQIISYFGPNSMERDEEVLKRIKENPWVPEDYDWGKVLEKHDKMRSVFNDPSRKRNKQLRWLRKKLITIAKEERCPIYKHKNHYERYLKKKVINRYAQLEKLKEIYGPDYDVNWESGEHIRKKLMSCKKSNQFVLEPAEAETHSDLEITPPGSEAEFEVNSALEAKENQRLREGERTHEEQLQYLKSLFSPSQLKNYKSTKETSESKKPQSMLRLLDASQLTSILSQSILVDQLNELMIEPHEKRDEDLVEPLEPQVMQVQNSDFPKMPFKVSDRP